MRTNIELVINGLRYLLHTSITLKYFNPVFHSNKGSYTFDFETPLTDELNKALNYPDDFQVKNEKRDIHNVTLLINGLSVGTGLLTVLEVDQSVVSMSLGFGKSALTHKMKTTKLSMLSDPISFTQNLGEYFESNKNKFYPESKFCTPQINTTSEFSFSKMHRKKIQGGVNLYYPQSPHNRPYIIFPLPLNTTPPSTTAESAFLFFNFSNSLEDLFFNNVTGFQVFSPGFYLNYVIDLIAQKIKSSIAINFFESYKDLNQLFILSEVVNRYTYDGTAIRTIDPKNYLPDLSILEFFQNLEKSFNVVFDIHNNQIRILNRKHILNNPKTRVLKNYSLSEVSEISKSDAAKGFEFWYSSLSGPTKDYIVKIDSENPLSPNTITNADLTNLSSFTVHQQNHIFKNTDNNFYYQLVAKNEHITTISDFMNSNFEFREIMNPMDRITHGDQDDLEEVNIEVSYIKKTSNSIYKFDNPVGVLAAGNHELNMTYSLKPDTDINFSDGHGDRSDKLHLLYYRGMQGSYPTASTDKTGFHDTDFKIQTMFEEYWDDWLYWFHSERDIVEILQPIDESDLMDIDFTECYSWPNHNLRGLIDSMEVEIDSDKEHIIASVKVHKL